LQVVAVVVACLRGTTQEEEVVVLAAIDLEQHYQLLRVMY
jgi:hypothetical protein